MTEKKTQSETGESGWVKMIAPYRNGDNRQSWWQITNTLIPYIVLWAVMVYSLTFSYWITLPLIILSSGFLVRLFIIFHDCGHGSFFESKKLSEAVGYLLGVLTFTPYHRWHHSHLIHHRTVGSLDKRGVGDVWTLTVAEYKILPAKKQLYYRIYRNPWIMFGIGAPGMFLISTRFTRKSFSRKEKISVYLNNLGIAVVATVLCLPSGGRHICLYNYP